MLVVRRLGVHLQSLGLSRGMWHCRARPEGVLLRPGHTEAAVDMANLAGCQPVGNYRRLSPPPS
jgi:hypothetical protein